MKKGILLGILLLLTGMAFGQSARLTGTVYDSSSKVPLEMATVTILDQDSVMITYQSSDKNGKVVFEKL